MASAAAMDALDCGGWVNSGRRSVKGDGLFFCAWVAAMSAPAGNGFVGLVAEDASAGDGFVGLVAMKMQALAGGWQASAGRDYYAGWRMKCERWPEDGKRWASAGGDDDASVSWQMECKHWLVDGERWLVDGVRASAVG